MALMDHENEQTELRKEKYVRFVGAFDLINNFGLPFQKHEGWPVGMKSGPRNPLLGRATTLTWH